MKDDTYAGEILTPIVITNIGSTEIYSGLFDGSSAIIITIKEDGVERHLAVHRRQLDGIITLLGMVKRNLQQMDEEQNDRN